MIRKIGSTSSRAKIGLAFLAGALCAVLRVATWHLWNERMAPIPIVLFLPLILLVLIYPMLSLRLALGTTMAASGGATIAGPIADRLIAGFWVSFPVEWLPIGSLVGCILFGTVSLFAVLIRRRYWPIYPSGYCQKCGYNLTGLASTQCPECGTFFEPQASSTARASPGTKGRHSELFGRSDAD
jgi:hypothetical protein